MQKKKTIVYDIKNEKLLHHGTFLRKSYTTRTV